MSRKRVFAIFSFFLFLCVILLIELLYRAILPLPEYPRFNRVDYTQLVESAKSAERKPLRHVSYTIGSEPDGVSFDHHLNLYGFRDREWTSEKKAPRVIFVGDSFVEGFMASENETIPRGFEQEAASNGEALEVFNMGVNAAGIPDYIQLCRDAIPLFTPDEVIVICYANDFPTPAYDPTWLQYSPEPERPILHRSRILYAVSNLWNGEPVPYAWNAAPYPYFAPIGSPENPWTEGGTSFEPFVEPKIAAAMKAGRLNPFMVNEVFWNSRFLTMPFDASDHIEKLGEYASSNGAELSIVYIPCRYQLSDDYLEFARAYCMEERILSLTSEEYQSQAKTLAEACSSADVPFLDLTGELKAREDAGDKLYWDYDSHMRGQSYLDVGSAIWRWRQKSGSR